MTQIRSNLLDFFTEGKLPQLEAVIESKKESFPSMLQVLFNVQPMTTDIYQTTTLSGLRNPRIKPEGVPVEFQTIQSGFPKTFTTLTYATAYRIAREMVRDGKENYIRRATDSFAKGMFEVKEYRLASIFDDGFTVNGYDGTPLFSTTHPLENGEGAVGVNRSAADTELSITSFRELRNVMQSTVNEQGQLVRYNPKWFVVGQNLQDEAMEILKSQYNPENANNTVNTVYNYLSLLPGNYWPYLSSDTSFFMVGDKSDHNLMFLPRDPFETDSDYDKKAFAYEVIASERFSYGYSGWRGVVGNAGA